MHTDSSASSTCLRLASAVEWTATVLMPNSRQARRMRNAISPRLAITTFSNIRLKAVGRRLKAEGRRGALRAQLLDDKERLPEFHGFAVLHQHRRHATGFVRFDLIHH